MLKFNIFFLKIIVEKANSIRIKKTEFQSFFWKLIAEKVEIPYLRNLRGNKEKWKQ